MRSVPGRDVPPDAALRWVDAQLDRLTPAERLAQRILVLPGVDAGRPDAATRRALALGVGILHSVSGMSALAAARYHNAVLETCLDAGVPPALISGNLESGVSYSLGTSGTHFPYPRGVGLSGDADLAYRVASAGAEEARRLGYHWTFSPCVDVVSVPDDPILGVRAYGVPSAETGTLASAQIRGYQDHGLIATAKHFPGHGDSSVDSHRSLPCVLRGSAEHETVHLPPFRAAVAAGVGSIMVAHVALPTLGVHEPASLSPLVNREWLRDRLGFAGLVITDSLRMEAVSRIHDPAQAALLALRAGADVANVKCPAEEAPRIIEHLAAALADGMLDRAELDQSVRRLMFARLRVGLDLPRPVIEDSAAALDAPSAWTDAARASTVHRSSAHGAGGLPRDATHVVVGDSALARRVAELGPEHGFRFVWASEPLAPDALASVVERHPDAALVPVFCPGMVPAVAQHAMIANAIADAAVSSRIAAILINSATSAESFADLGDRIVSTPAVDAFGVLTDAAVRAALDALG
jgi:beta-N-acetylhexosaminidase